LFGCAGYEPLFATKKLSFYIEKIENIKDDNITKNISRNLNLNKSKSDNTKSYILKISSDMANRVAAKNTKGQTSSYEMIVNVKVEVLSTDSELLLKTFNFRRNFNYNNQVNKFNLNQYKNNILQNIINKISQDIIIKLQSL
jgi:outer membrane lipopolysaccharide assembly protein LptE/RlpB